MSDHGYKFLDTDGQQHVLPPLKEDAASKIPGDITYNAVMRPDDQMAQLRLAFATLEAAKPNPAAMDALKAFTTEEMLTHVAAWMGESSPSSD